MSIPQQQRNYEFGYACDVGHKRRGEPNQDAVEVILSDRVPGSPPPLLIVADGLGGHRGGSTASQLVTQVFKQEFLDSRHPTNYSQLLDMCARKAHSAVQDLGSQDTNLSAMGSTVVAVVLEETRLSLLNVGDSRAYILRGGEILQVSQDQSWVAVQVRHGALTPDEAFRHPDRSRLNMAISAKRAEIEPYVSNEPLEPDDIVILCSDGLWGVIPETLIWATARELQPQAAADKLIALANNSGGPDNISVIIAHPFDLDYKAVDVSMEETDPGI
jgi:protein phosphatase